MMTLYEIIAIAVQKTNRTTIEIIQISRLSTNEKTNLSETKEEEVVRLLWPNPQSERKFPKVLSNAPNAFNPLDERCGPAAAAARAATGAAKPHHRWESDPLDPAERAAAWKHGGARPAQEARGRRVRPAPAPRPLPPQCTSLRTPQSAIAQKCSHLNAPTMTRPDDAGFTMQFYCVVGG